MVDTQRPLKVSKIFLLIVGAILTTGIIVFVPLSSCPVGHGDIKKTTTTSDGYIMQSRGCGYCRSTNKISLLKVLQIKLRRAEWEPTQGVVDQVGLNPREVKDIRAVGFVNQNIQACVHLTGIRRGEVLTREKKESAIKELFKTGKFEEVHIDELVDPADSTKLIVEIIVREK